MGWETVPLWEGWLRNRSIQTPDHVRARPQSLRKKLTRSRKKCQGGILQVAEKLISMQIFSRTVTGHDFSRANNANRTTVASAPARFYLRNSSASRPFPQPLFMVPQAPQKSPRALAPEGVLSTPH